LFPIGDTDVRGADPGYVTIGLVVINVVVFLLEITMSQSGLKDFVYQYGVVPTEILQGKQLYSLLTSMFIHAGWFHILGNMLFLWIFGDNVEAALGHGWYLAFYLAGGVVGSLAYAFVSMGSASPTIGASGAIAAVLGAYIVMFPRSRVRVFIVPFFITGIAAVVFLALWFVLQLVSGFAGIGAETAQTGGVAFFAHIGGFIMGLLVGFLTRDRAGKLDFERS
jgi:membrane associated rhomboid family serine protease